MRIHLFEFEDQEWLPNAVRKGITDYLRYVFKVVDYYAPSVPLIAKAIEKTGDKTIIELCSGGGGPIEYVRQELSRLNKSDIEIYMSDKYPNLHTFNYIRLQSKGSIDYIHDSVDATNVSPKLKGFRLMYTAFHHFKPEQAKAILKDAVDQKSGIGIFDIGERSFMTLFGNSIINPVAILLFSPFFRPFSYSRMFFTYIVPFIPLISIWDGVVSMLRLYDEDSAKKLISELDNTNYKWEIGKVKNKFGMKIFYILGMPQ